MPLRAAQPKFVFPPIAWIGILLCVFLIFGDTQGIIGSKPPYVVPVSLPVAVAVAYDGTPTALQKLTDEYPNVIGTVQAWVKAKGGEYAGIDTTVTEKPSMASDWEKAAWDVIDKTKPPRIIGATPNSGIPDQPLPKTPDEATKLLSTLLK